MKIINNMTLTNKTTLNDRRRVYIMQIYEALKLVKFNNFTHNDIKNIMNQQTFSRLSKYNIVIKQHNNVYKFTGYSVYFLEHNLPYTSQYEELINILGDYK